MVEVPPEISKMVDENLPEAITHIDDETLRMSQ